MDKKPFILAISGCKNSGKTTLITKLIPKFVEINCKVATIKHDGHDFEGDEVGTDTYKHKKSGAYGSAIFSKNKFMIIKEQKDTDEKELIDLFPEADVILLEGFKYSNYPKLEIVRKGNSSESICNKENLIAVLSDLEEFDDYCKIIDLNDLDLIFKEVLNYMKIFSMKRGDIHDR